MDLGDGLTGRGQGDPGPLFGRPVKLALTGIVAVAVLGYLAMALWVLPNIPDINLTLVRGELVPIDPPLDVMPGKEITFQGDYVGEQTDLRRQFDRHGFNVKLWGLSQDPEERPEYLSFESEEYWHAALRFGAAMYMFYVEATGGFQGRDYYIALSDPGMVTVNRTPAVANSPMIEISAERIGSYRYEPFARIVAKVAGEDGDPAITNLTSVSTHWAIRLNPPPVEEFPYTSTSYGGPWGGSFQANGTIDNGWIVYVAEPLPELPGDPDLITGRDICLVVCWVAGRDSTGRIHFASPLVFTASFHR